MIFSESLGAQPRACCSNHSSRDSLEGSGSVEPRQALFVFLGLDRVDAIGEQRPAPSRFLRA